MNRQKSIDSKCRQKKKEVAEEKPSAQHSPVVQTTVPHVVESGFAIKTWGEIQPVNPVHVGATMEEKYETFKDTKEPKREGRKRVQKAFLCVD